MDTFEKFYREHGVKRFDMLLRPKLTPDDLLVLPRNSVLHYLTQEPTSGDIDVKQFPFIKQSKCYVKNLLKLESLEGNPRYLSGKALEHDRDFYHRHHEVKKLQQPVSAFTNQLYLLLINYELLKDNYLYQERPIMHYDKWFNLSNTLWITAETIAKETNRHQFIIVKIPDKLPSLSTLKINSKTKPIITLKLFNSYDRLGILDIFKWLDFKTKDNTLSHLSLNNLHLINIIFYAKQHISIVNLGYLHSLVKETDEEAEELSKIGFIDDSLIKAGVKIDTHRDVKQIQQYFVAFLAKNQIDIEKHVEVENKSEVMREEDNLLDNDELDIIAESTTKDIEEIESKQMKDEEVVITEDTFKKKEDEELIPKDIETHEALGAYLENYVKQGTIGAVEYKKLKHEVEKANTVKDPDRPHLLLTETTEVLHTDLAIDKDKTKIDTTKNILDTSILSTPLLSFDSDYVSKVMDKDIKGAALHMQRAGIMIHDYQIDRVNSILGDYENHTIKLKPIDGIVSTVKFKLPIIDDEGSFCSNGNTYKLRKQKSDLPIRKLDDHTIALSSYYGKLFIQRCLGKAYSLDSYLFNALNLKALEDNELELVPVNVFDNTFKAPRIYSAISKYFGSIKNKHYNLTFNHKKRKQLNPKWTDRDIEGFEKHGIVVSSLADGAIVLNDKDQLLKVTDKEVFLLSNIYNALDINYAKAPMGYIELRLMGNKIPIAHMLGYLLGLTNVIKYCSNNTKVIDRNKRYALQENEWELVFADKKLIFDKRDQLATLVLSGLLQYKKTIKEFEYRRYDNKNIYLNLLESKKMSPRIVREYDLLDQLFIDHITKTILAEMKEPNSFKPLLLRACELLVDDHHLDSNDMSQMRIRGFERIAGIVYKEMSQAVRGYKNRIATKRLQIEVNPYAVSKALMEDPTIKLTEDINPIQNLKDQEIVTLVGEGGRTKEAINELSRTYHPSEIGVISEATIDSSDVGINIYLSCSPNINSLRGVTSKRKEESMSRALSTSANLAPFVENEAPIRVNFISIQQSHTIAAKDYSQSLVRTGYEAMLPYRVSKLFAYMAEEDGVVESITKDGIIVAYKNKKQGIKLGREYGRAEGTYYLHEIVSPLKAKDKFKKGACVAYNSGFFEPDYLDPKQIIYKGSMLAKVALMETTQTFEDSSSMSRNLSNRMEAKTIKLRSFTFKFKQNISKLVSVGTVLEPNSVLFIMEDEVTDNTGLFDEDSLDTLKQLAGMAPKAKYKGTVDKLEVYYNGNISGMSNSLRKIATEADNNLKTKQEAIGASVLTGKVTSDYKISGDPIEPNTLELKIYIVVNNRFGNGDKAVFANQMKTVCGEIMDYPVKTKSGEIIDSVFSYSGISRRAVLSPILLGTTNTLLKLIAKKAVQLHKSK